MVGLRPVRLRDGTQWSRLRLADRAHLEPWEPSSEASWEMRHALSSWPAVCSGLRGEARRGRML
ncbi:MAG: family acetyltransferase, partial [Mycobacterium sp.]|nr:family acetyltransferase [Mycobacterium sp.]